MQVDERARRRHLGTRVFGLVLACVAVGLTSWGCSSGKEGPEDPDPQAVAAEAGQLFDGPRTLVTMIPARSLPRATSWAIYRRDDAIGGLTIEASEGPRVLAGLAILVGADHAPRAALYAHGRDLSIDASSFIEAAWADMRSHAGGGSGPMAQALEPQEALLQPGQQQLLTPESCLDALLSGLSSVGPPILGLTASVMAAPTCVTGLGCAASLTGATASVWFLRNASTKEWPKVKAACLQAFDCGSRSNGTYCGPNRPVTVLYECIDGATSVKQGCAMGCGSNGASSGSDACLAPPSCSKSGRPLKDGLYCGNDIERGQSPSLYWCRDGQATVHSYCPLACQASDDGFGQCISRRYSTGGGM